MNDEPFSYMRRIEYLVRRQFPDHKSLKHPPGQGSPAPNAKRVEEFELYVAELEKMSPTEIDALYEVERKKEADASRPKLRKKDKRPHSMRGVSKADLAHWSKAAYWTLDEAVSLSFGWEPQDVNWRAIEIRAQTFAQDREFMKVRDLVQRASLSLQLPANVAPSQFLAWAKRHDIAYPPKLAEQVLRWSGEHTEQTTKQGKQSMDVDESRNSSPQLDSPTEPLQAKERDSVLKLIIGMAVAGYRFDPRAARNDATTDIVGDLERLGIPLDPGTVRKWLREAATLLPPQSQAESDS